MKHVLVVGNCDYDGPRIVEVINTNFKAKAVESKTLDDAMKLLDDKEYDFVLVNRVGAEDGREGLELIDWMKKHKKETPIMLITNFKDKMTEAVKHGAVQGFGKQDLDSEKTITLLKKYLE